MSPMLRDNNCVLGALIIRKLCALLDPGSVFTGLAQALLASEELCRNKDFVMVYTHALNIILLTAPETQGLRSAVSSDRLVMMSTKLAILHGLILPWIVGICFRLFLRVGA